MNLTEGNGSYQYILKPCVQSGSDSPVTQYVLSSGNSHSLGKGDGILRYADRTLSLTYFMGDPCSNGIHRTSIITFTCPGSGRSCRDSSSKNCVFFVTENHCIYEFEWVSELACASTNSKSSCGFELGGLSYDLGRLTEGSNPTYAAVSLDNDTECYLINPCGQLVGTSDLHTPAKYCNLRVAPSSCWNNSVCQIRRSSPFAVGFGTFNIADRSMLQAYDKNVFSVSTKPRGNGKQAIVRYICETGRLQSYPTFISHLTANLSEFHWPTYAACPQASQVGSNCIVKEKSTGFSFNLTSLSRQSYLFNNSKYSYKIRVCDSLPQGECEAGAAVCQQAIGSNKLYSCGKPNSTLRYADSSLKLVYSGGHSCSNGDNRTTTITFICDPNAHQSVVENVTEIRHCEYLVEMRTKQACPPAYRATECVLFTPNGSTYDLRELARVTGNWQTEGPDGSVYIINVCRPLNLQGIGGCNPLSAACRITSGQTTSNIDIGYASSATLNVSKAGGYLILQYTYSTPSSDSQASRCSKVITEIRLICNPNAPPEVS